MSTSLFQRWQKPLLLSIIFCWVMAIICSFTLVPKLVLDGFDGTSVEAVNNKIDSHRRQGEANGEDRSREWYAEWAHGYALRASALSTLLFGGAAALVGIAGLRRQVRRFLMAPSSALNLGVLRFIVFGMQLSLLLREPIREFAGWERENFVWPFVSGPIFSKLPISVEIVDMLMPIAIVATLMAMFGMLTRTSAWVALILGVYLLGIPQCSGKVNHTMHHVILIGLLMACSRCGDAFSLDSIWHAIRRADHGRVRRLRRSVRYGLPIRLALMILATCYFFPGFWKIASNGTAWAFSDNLDNQMLQKWFESETFTPILPLYKLPLFTTMGALTTLVFELLFPIAILYRPTRVIWGSLGILFHNMTLLLMNISFYTMQGMYAAFVDWQRFFAWIGRKLFGDRLVILFDGNCKLCRRTVSILLAFDWFKSLQAINAFDRDRFAEIGLGHLDDGELMTDMHAAWRDPSSSEWETAKGYHAYQQIAWRVPVLWLALPFIYLGPVVGIGKKIYRKVADSRACTVPSAPVAAPVRQSLLGWSAWPILVVAVGILSMQGLLGVARLRKSWPVACYPLFDTLSSDTVRWPEFEAKSSDGSITVLDDDPIRDRFTESRYVPAMKRFVATPVDREEIKGLLAGYLPVWKAAGMIGETPPEKIAIYISTYKLTGPSRPAKPEEREELLEFDWSELQ